jgi:hypothetical protein
MFVLVETQSRPHSCAFVFVRGEGLVSHIGGELILSWLPGACANSGPAMGVHRSQEFIFALESTAPYPTSAAPASPRETFGHMIFERRIQSSPTNSPATPEPADGIHAPRNSRTAEKKLFSPNEPNFFFDNHQVGVNKTSRQPASGDALQSVIPPAPSAEASAAP